MPKSNNKNAEKIASFTPAQLDEVWEELHPKDQPRREIEPVAARLGTTPQNLSKQLQKHDCKNRPGTISALLGNYRLSETQTLHGDHCSYQNLENVGKKSIMVSGSQLGCNGCTDPIVISEALLEPDWKGLMEFLQTLIRRLT